MKMFTLGSNIAGRSRYDASGAVGPKVMMDVWETGGHAGSGAPVGKLCKFVISPRVGDRRYEILLDNGDVDLRSGSTGKASRPQQKPMPPDRQIEEHRTSVVQTRIGQHGMATAFSKADQNIR